MAGVESLIRACHVSCLRTEPRDGRGVVAACNARTASGTSCRMGDSICATVSHIVGIPGAAAVPSGRARRRHVSSSRLTSSRLLSPSSIDQSSSSVIRPKAICENEGLASEFKFQSKYNLKSHSRSETKRRGAFTSCVVAMATGGASTMAPTGSEKEEKDEQLVELTPGDQLGPEYTSSQNFYHNDERRAGVLMHPTSLPGPHGVGDFGDGAFAFIDWLQTTGCSIWQILPLVPPGRKSGEDGSPYSGQDANCGNTLLISLDRLVGDGLLDESELPAEVPVERVDFMAVADLKDPLIAKAATRLLLSDGALKKQYETFRADPRVSGWLENAALFAAIDNSVDFEFWWEWPADLRDAHPEAMDKIRKTEKDFIDQFCAQQFLFQKQWDEIHRYANEAGIKIMGDMPIYVGGHSADVWSNRKLFTLDEETGTPVLVSGVPPDAFSATGQRWGSPLYDWAAMAEEKYSWWIARMRRAFELYDEFRIDHFRAFAGYWAIPAEEETAIAGTWKLGPRIEFFNALQSALGDFKIVAEDLGVITKDVVDLRKEINAPGMAVLQFAFGGDSKNPHLPHNHETNQVVYPGTHDNDTVLGWFQKIEQWEKDKVCSYLLCDGEEDVISWVFIRSALSSVAQSSIVAMQDVMGLDNSARMNTPAVKAGNWGWRMGALDTFQTLADEAKTMKALVRKYNRLSPSYREPPVEQKEEEEEEAASSADELAEPVTSTDSVDGLSTTAAEKAAASSGTSS